MLDACRTRWLDEPHAWALLERDRVVAANAGARELGVEPGLRRSGADALAPQACLIERDRRAEQALFDQAALATLAYTPYSAQYEDHTLLMEVQASLRLFGGPRRLLRRLQADVAACGVQARAAMAPTAHGAWLLARHAGRRPARHVLQRATLARRLDALPCALLPQARAVQDWLEGIACANLGQLRRLPRAGLARRSSPALLHALDQAYQPDGPPALAWFVPPARYQARAELIERLEHLQAVQAVIERLLQGLYRWLAASRLAVRSLLIELEHERGRHARAPTTLHLALAEPAWRHEHLQGPLQEHCSRLPWGGPVAGVRLRTLELAEQPAVCGQLFPEPGSAPADYRRLLDLLRARLGPEGVLGPQGRADHRPEQANLWGPLPPQAALPGTASGRGPGPAGAAAPPSLAFPASLPAAGERPFWLLAEPIPLALHRHKPVYGTPLTLLRGPERIESGWWSGHYVKRDYFIAQDAGAARYWIFRERRLEAARWFLHGLFG